MFGRASLCASPLLFLQTRMDETTSPDATPTVMPGSPEWRKSVEEDLSKACATLKKAHDAESEATMAVLLAEVEYDASVSNSSKMAKILKEEHTNMIRKVNEGEHKVRDLLEGDVQFEPVHAQTMRDYASNLKERSGTLYTCHTHTLAARHMVSTRARKLSACKQHLINMVEDRTTAEREVERLSGIYADGFNRTDELLQEQLALVRSGAAEKHLAHTNTDLSFLAGFKELCKLFSVPGDKEVSLPATSFCEPVAVPHEEHDAQVDKAPMAATTDFTHDVYA